MPVGWLFTFSVVPVPPRCSPMIVPVLVTVVVTVLVVAVLRSTRIATPSTPPTEVTSPAFVIVFAVALLYVRTLKREAME